MTITPEMLAAFADGELDEVSAARVQSALGTDSVLAAQLEGLRSLKGTLSAHYDQILTQPVPDRITAPIGAATKVVDLGAVRAARQRWVERPALRYGGGAVAAALALALVMVGSRQGAGPSDLAGPQLASALDSQPSGVVGPGGTKILLSFRDKAGSLCRGFTEKADAGIACRDSEGWAIRMRGAAGGAERGDYRQAGSADAAVMAAAQDLAAGDAFDADQEAAAIAGGWKR